MKGWRCSVIPTLSDKKFELEVELDELIKLKRDFNIDHVEIPKYLPFHDLLKLETTLERIADEIRFEWKKKCFLHTEHVYKSPPYPQEFMTLNNSKLDFRYERVIKYRSWEDKHYNSINNFSGFSMFFSSGMSAIFNVLHLVRIMFKGELDGVFLGDYYETRTLIRNLSIENIHYEHVNDASLLNRLNKVDILIVELVRYSTTLSVVEEDDIINFINHNKSVKAVIIDFTLVSSSFNIEKFLNRIDENVFVFFIKSTLKLDQSGLEFSNSAQLSLYIKSVSAIPEYVEKLRTLLEGQRGALGSSLSYYEVCQLDYPMFNKDAEYVNKVLNNVTSFVSCLENSKLEIIHPSLLNPRYKSPFLFVKTESNEDFYKFMGFIDSYLEDNHINIPKRNSFGFRNISMEMVQMNKTQNVLKIAPGRIDGMKQQALIEGIMKFNKK